MEFKPRFKEENEKGVLEINEEVYPWEVAVSAAYCFIDRAYLRFTSSSKGFSLEIIPKNEGVKPSDIADKILNEMVSYSAFAVQISRNGSAVRSMFKVFERTNELNNPEPSSEQLLSELEKIYENRF